MHVGGGSGRRSPFGGVSSSFRAAPDEGMTKAPPAPAAAGFRRPPPSEPGAPSASQPLAARRLSTTGGAEVQEIVSMRGSGKYTELLVSWRGNLSSRPSWVLRLELEKNPSFKAAYTAYVRTRGYSA